MKRALRLAVVLVAVAGGAAAQEAITMKIEPATMGCSTGSGSNAFPVLGWSFGTTTPATTSGGAGAAKISDLVLTRSLDPCSVALFATSVSGATMPQATLTQTDPSEN